MTELDLSGVTTLILTLNQRDKTMRCLASLQAAEERPLRVLVWDNGSEDGTREAVQAAHPLVQVHRHPDNLGVASGRNAAAAMARALGQTTHLLFLDNDLLLEPGFVSELLRPFAEDARIGQTQAKLRLMHDRARLNDGGGNRISFVFGQTRPVGFGEIDRGQYDIAKRCVACGGAMMVRADVFQQLGGFDTRFDPFGPEDLDFSLRLSRAGYAALYVPRAVAYHEVSHTFGEGYSGDYARHKARHWFLFLSRHASLPQKIGFFTIGAPYLALRVLVREARRGNMRAVEGLVRGGFDSLRAWRAAKSGR